MVGGTNDVEAVVRSPLSPAPAGGLFGRSSDEMAVRHPHAEATSAVTDTSVAPQAAKDVPKRARAKFLCQWTVGSRSRPHYFTK